MRPLFVYAQYVVLLGVVLLMGCPSDPVDNDDPVVPDTGIDAGVDDMASPDVTPPPPDIPTSTCVDAGCPDAELPHCDATSGRCVACLDAADCEDLNAPICRSGICEACQTDTQCADASDRPTCRADGRCVTCERDADCPVELPVCDGEGECRQCAESQDCPSVAPACVAGTCASCADTDCSDDVRVREVVGLLCEQAVRLEGQYDESSVGAQIDATQAVTCAGDPSRWAFLGALIDAIADGRVDLDDDAFTACRLDGECDGLFVPQVADGDACFADVDCISGICDTSATCPGLCDLRRGAGESCASNGDCRTSLTCINTVCETVPTTVGAACSTRCGDDLFCESGACAMRKGIDETCASTGECLSDLYCNPDTARCTAFPGPGELCLIPGAFCRDGVRCFKGICQDPQPVGSACEATAQCEPGLRCIDETACVQILVPGQQCTESSHCALGLGCIDGRCRTLPDVGAPCFEEGGCLRGVCNTDSGTCEALPVDAACGGAPYPFDMFDPCGDASTCAGDGTGNSRCLVDGGVGAPCGSLEPPCRAPDTQCRGGVCEALCEAEAM